jgi:hypothetical protein
MHAPELWGMVISKPRTALLRSRTLIPLQEKQNSLRKISACTTTLEASSPSSGQTSTAAEEIQRCLVRSSFSTLARIPSILGKFTANKFSRPLSLHAFVAALYSVDDFWPWVNNKAEAGTTYRGKQHFRSTYNIAAPRDGVPIDSNDAATDTINDDEASAIPNTDGTRTVFFHTLSTFFTLLFFLFIVVCAPTATRRYGMHESYDQYQLCQRTERNKGLYTADQLINRNDQRGTRQNPNGNRRGLECPEERDYYPWWHPSPWIGKLYGVVQRMSTRILRIAAQKVVLVNNCFL